MCAFVLVAVAFAETTPGSQPFGKGFGEGFRKGFAKGYRKGFALLVDLSWPGRVIPQIEVCSVIKGLAPLPRTRHA